MGNWESSGTDSNQQTTVTKDSPLGRGLSLRNTPDGRSEEGSEGRGPPLGVPVEWNYRPGIYVSLLSAGTLNINRINSCVPVVTSSTSSRSSLDRFDHVNRRQAARSAAALISVSAVRLGCLHVEP